MKIVTILILSASLLTACTQSSLLNDCTTIKLNPTENKNWEDILDVEDVVPLEQTHKSLLTMASQCKVKDGKVFFADYKLKSLFVFDVNGNFKFEAGTTGMAAYEHAMLNDFCYNAKDKKISILDERGIANYDASNGQFLNREKLLDTRMVVYEKFKDLADGSKLLFSSSDKYSISLKYKSGKIKGLRERDGFQLITDRFSPGKDGILVSPDYGHFVIDCYRDGQLFPKYDLDFGTQALPQKYISKKYEDFMKTSMMKPYFKSVISAMENGHWLYVSVVGPEQKYYDIFFDKLTGNVYAGRANMSIGMNIVDIDDDYLYALAYLDYMKEDSPFYKHFKKYKDEGFGNPILVKFRFKEKQGI